MSKLQQYVINLRDNGWVVKGQFTVWATSFDDALSKARGMATPEQRQWNLDVEGPVSQ